MRAVEGESGNPVEVIRAIGTDAPQLVHAVADALEHWDYDLPIPTDDTRCLGFILEQSIALHLQRTMPQCDVTLGGAIAYPNLRISEPGGPSLAFEVKASPRTQRIGNRVKSPDSILEFWDRFDGHWVMAVFYEFTAAKDRLHRFRCCLLPLWQYASAIFKDMSAISALGSLDAMLRNATVRSAFRDEAEFLDFARYMVDHPGTTAQRNAAAKEWLLRRRAAST